MAQNKTLRTCLITNTKSDPSDFFRFTIQDGKLVFDTHKKNPGRGGYVKKNTEALEKLAKIPGKIMHFLKSKKCEISDTVIAEQKAKVQQ